MIVLSAFDGVLTVLCLLDFRDSEGSIAEDILVGQRHYIAGFKMDGLIACLKLNLQGANLVVVPVESC